jgi:hypothetical protein
MTTSTYRPPVNTGTLWPIARRPGHQDPQFIGTVNISSVLLSTAVWAERSNPELRVADIMSLRFANLLDKTEVRARLNRFVRQHGDKRPNDPAFFGTVTVENAAYNLSVWVNLKQKEGQPDKPYLSLRFTPHQSEQMILLVD